MVLRPSRRRSWRTSLVAAAAGAVLAVTAACSSGAAADQNTDPNRPLTFGLVIMDTTNPFQATMAEAAKAEAAKRGITVEVLNGNLNISNQVSAVQQQIANGVDALILNAVDPNGIIPAIKQANSANIPVVALNTAVSGDADIVTFVGADDYQYGFAQGELTASALNGQGTVAIVMGQVGTSPQALRTKGIEDALAKYPGIQIVDRVADDWKNAKSLAAVQDLLSKHPQGQLDAIVAEGPQIYVGADWAHSQGRTDVKFIGGDYPTQVKDAIKAGSLYGTVLQSPEQEGQLAVDAAEKWVRGQQDQVQRPNTYIDLPAVTIDNVDKYDTVWTW